MDLRVKRHIEMTETFQLVDHLKISQGIVVLICLHLMILPRLVSPGKAWYYSLPISDRQMLVSDRAKQNLDEIILLDVNTEQGEVTAMRGGQV